MDHGSNTSLLEVGAYLPIHIILALADSLRDHARATNELVRLRLHAHV